MLETFADIIKLYISGVGHTMKLKFSSVVHLSSTDQIFQYRYAVQCGRGLHFEHGLYISALQQAGMLILSIYVLLASINIIYKYCHAWVIE